MKLPLFSAVSLLVSLAAFAPPIANSEKIIPDSEKIIVTTEFFDDCSVIYTGEHDIVSLTVPINTLNFGNNSYVQDGSSTDPDDLIVIFFVEADMDNRGDKDYKGLYAHKNGKATKLLDKGTTAAAANDDTKFVYFGAKDGLYVYNSVENKAEKYGSVTDSIIDIAKENGTDVIYIITEDHDLYKVTDGGNTKVKVDEVTNAQQIALDFSNNLYYYGPDKQAFVVNAGGAKKIEGLPENPTYVSLVTPPFIRAVRDSVIFVADHKSYVLNANGTSEVTKFEMQAKPTAFAGRARSLQFYAYNKNIYKCNIAIILLGQIFGALSKVFKNNTDSVQSIARAI